MLFNFKTILTGVVLAVVGAFVSTPAHATFFTELATMDIASTIPKPVGTPAPISNISQINQSPGETFTNTYGINFGTGGVNVRTVGIAVIDSVLSPNKNNLSGVGNQDVSLAVVFALNGATSAGAPTTVTFNEGGFAVFKLPSNDAGTFVPSDPTTWGVNLANPVIIGQLALPTDVTKGTGAPISFGASTVNTSGTNTVAQNEFQGRTLFDVTSNPNPDSAGNIPFISVQNPTNAPGPIGIFSTFQENVDNPTSVIGTSGLTVLNNLAGFFAPQGITDLNGSGSFFATGLGASLSDYNPGTQIGDFSSNLQNLTSYAGIDSPVPEPGSMVLLASGSVLAGLFARRRKNAKQA